MPDDVIQPAAESSPAVSVPSDPQTYAEWRMTGKVPSAAPEKKAKPEASPAPKLSAAADDAAENDAPASEAGNKQERKRGNAESVSTSYSTICGAPACRRPS